MPMNTGGQRQARTGRGGRTHLTSSMARVVNGLLSPAARRRGFAHASIVGDWPSIVGRSMAGRCQPVRIEFRPGTKEDGVLFLRVSGGAALEIQHVSTRIIERINDYLGFKAVRHIRLIQGAIPKPAKIAAEPEIIALSDEEEAAIASDVKEISSDGLKQALMNLGRTIKREGRD